MPRETANLAILFADVSGSTRLYEKLGDARARKMVADCVATLSEVTGKHEGTVIKTIGDEVMTTFPSADAAVQAACEMQEVITDEAAVSGTPLTIRVGLHFGPVIKEAGDVFGDAVNLAARMAGMSKGGQIITTKDTVDQLELSLSASTRQIDRATVKGKQEVIDIFEVIWQREDLTSMAGDLGLPGVTQASLRLRFHDKELEYDQNRLAFSIGRGPNNDLVVPHDFTSRVHARIEFRRGKFVLIDQSTNGTFVTTEDGREIYLRREELMLEGTGNITFGRRLPADSPELVHFFCES